MVELAPHHKIGLNLSSPVMIGSGSGGYGPAYRQLLDLSLFGALVTNPITLRPRRGRPQPRLSEITGGLILDTGGQNPGVKKVIRQYEKIWRSLKIPIIAHLPADDPADLLRTARALSSTEAVDAVELGVPTDAYPEELSCWIRAIQSDCMLPLLVKLPLNVREELVEVAVDASADALVIGSPPAAATTLPAGEQIISGGLFSPVLYHIALHDTLLVASLVDIPVVAVGGIHSLSAATDFLSVGATAVQLDTVLWIDPKRAERIAKNFIKPD